MKALRLVSLFSGMGGLEQGIGRALDVEVVAHAEIEPAANRVLAARYPGVPNLGDVSAIDWRLWAGEHGRVDVLCGGFPCQDVSHAGLRRGIRPDSRSGLWSEFARAIAELRPSLVVIENVRGLTSAPAHRPLESDEIALGDGSVRPALRALGAVLGDLADLRFDAEWIGLRASDVGAPHSRFRIFLVATPADPGGEARDLGSRLRPAGPWLGRRRPDHGGRPAAPDADRLRLGGVPPAHDDDGTLALGDESLRRAAPDAAREPRASGDALGGVRDGEARLGGEEPRRRDRDRPAGEEPAGAAPDALRDAGERRGGPGAVAGAVGEARHEDGRPADERGHAAGDRGEDPRLAWGPYAGVVDRWERRLGRVAPTPTADGKLSAPFVEWMMGLPAGWLTDPDLGLSRPQQLRLLGNGVVPQQAEKAVRLLLARGR